MENFNKPAYPTPFTDGYGGIYQGQNNNGEGMFSSDPGGMTKLEEFTKAAMQGCLSNPHVSMKMTAKDVGKFAIECAVNTLKLIEDYNSVTDKMK